MKLQVCPNCGGNEFTETSDAWICQFCDTRHPKPAPKVIYPAAPALAPAPVKVEPAAPKKPVGSSVVPQTYEQRQRQRNKWVAFFLCFFLGIFGIHKFYENKIFMGLLYLFTYGLFGVGWLIDCIVLLCKPNPYYV